METIPTLRQKSIHDAKNPLLILNAAQGDLASLLSKAKHLAALQEAILPLLDPTVKKHCQAANVNDDTLVILTANGSAATQLRFQTPDLLKQFQGHPALAQFKHIQIKVRPPLAPSQKLPANTPARKMQPLSVKSAQMIRETAATIDDPELRAAMLNMAENSED